MFNLKNLPPFPRFCCSIGHIPTSYTVALSYEEQLFWLCDFLKNTVIPAVNNNADALEEVQRLFIQLKDYVDNYFTNLDVQEEINNTLDQMVEDGTLASIINEEILGEINEKLDKILPYASELNFQEYISYNFDTSVKYNGYSHFFLQGFCKVENNIVMGMYDATHHDDYVLLTEFNPETKEILRQKYLLLYHCNSITYNPINKKLYIATNSQANNGEVINRNSIIIVDYDSFEIDSENEISNLTPLQRIRSVYYDTEESQLYAGNTYTMFKINTSDFTITETINLEAPPLIYSANNNQTLKKIKNMYVGIFFTFICFWDLSGNLKRMINIPQINSGDKLGEVEDFYLDNNDNIVIGATKRLSAYDEHRMVQFYKTNLNINSTNIYYNYAIKNDDRPLVLYVDNTSNTEIENGSTTNPFKNLQRAINLCKNLNVYGSIHVKGNHYPLTSIIGVEGLSIYFEENIEIDGLYIVHSNVQIASSVEKTHTINGLISLDSNVRLTGYNATLTINKLNNSLIPNHNGKTIASIFSKIFIEYANINGNQDSIPVLISKKSDVAFNQCVFDGYDGYSCIEIRENSICKLNQNTFSIAANDDNPTFRIVLSSVLYSQPNLQDTRHYFLSYYGKIFGVLPRVNNDLIDNKFLGNVCEIPNDMTNVKIRVKVAGTNSLYKWFDIPLVDIGTISLDTQWVSAGGNSQAVINIRNNEGNLEIYENKKCYITNAGVYSFFNLTNEDLTDKEPSNPTSWACIDRVLFYSH